MQSLAVLAVSAGPKIGKVLLTPVINTCAANILIFITDYGVK